MQLHLRDSNDLLDDKFARWLIVRIRFKLISSISRYNLTNWDKYFNTSKEVNRLYKDKTYRASDIIIFAANNLVYTSTKNEIRIFINNNKFVPGYDRLKLSVASKTLNYGTIDIKGCHIFTDVLEQFAKDINIYVAQFYRL